MHQHLTRRDIIKTILVTSATSLIGNKVWAAKVISDVTANVVDPNTGVARIQLSSFAALNNNGGSVRLGSSNIVRTPSGDTAPAGLFYPIIINRVSATEYVALESACAHAGCVVERFAGTVTTGRINCNCHGSQYDIRGHVVTGPAQFDLLSYETSVSNGILTIKIPDAGFQSKMTTVLNGTQTRLEFKWSSFSGVEYELRFRPSFATEATAVPFFTTLAGTTTVTFTTGNNTPDTSPSAKKIYVVPQDGIYQVAIRLRSL